MKQFYKNLKFLSLLILAILFFSSCSDESKKTKHRIETAKIIETRSTRDLLNDLYIGCEGDVWSLSRMLGVTPSVIERLRTGETVPTEDFEKRVRDVSVYYAQNRRSYNKLRSILDEDWKWYDSVLHWPSLSPWSFWIVVVVLLLLLAFATLFAIWPILGIMLLFLISWIFSIVGSFSEQIEDSYTNTINPVIERLK